MESIVTGLCLIYEQQVHTGCGALTHPLFPCLCFTYRKGQMTYRQDIGCRLSRMSSAQSHSLTLIITVFKHGHNSKLFLLPVNLLSLHLFFLKMYGDLTKVPRDKCMEIVHGRIPGRGFYPLVSSHQQMSTLWSSRMDTVSNNTQVDCGV